MRFMNDAIPQYMYEYWVARARSSGKKDPAGFLQSVTEQRVCLVATAILFCLKLYEETGEATEKPLEFSPLNAERKFILLAVITFRRAMITLRSTLYPDLRNLE